jgi:hypothetical protein
MVWKWIKNKKMEKAERAKIYREKNEFVKRVRINKVSPEYPIPEEFLRSISEDALIEIVADTYMGEDAIKMAGEILAARDISEAGMKELSETLERNSKSAFPVLCKDNSMAVIEIFASAQNATESARKALIIMMYGGQKSIAEAAAGVLKKTPEGRSAIRSALGLE